MTFISFAFDILLISLCLQAKITLRKIEFTIEKIVNRYIAYTCSNIVIDFFGIVSSKRVTKESRTQVASNVIALNDIPGFQLPETRRRVL